MINVLNVSGNAKELINNIQGMLEAQKGIEAFETDNLNNISFSSKNQAKYKRKMSLLKASKNVADLAVVTLTCSLAYGLLKNTGASPETLSVDNLTQLYADASSIYDYVSKTKIHVPLLALATFSFSTSSILKNPSEIRFHQKEKEQNKILREFFKDSFIINMESEADMLMIGYTFTDALKRHKGTENKMTPFIIKTMFSSFSPSNSLEFYNKSNPSQEVESQSVHEFVKTLLTDKREINSYLQDIKAAKIIENNKFDKRDEAKYLCEKIEQAFEKTYREEELRKTMLIGTNMLITAEKAPEKFLKLYEKYKNHFEKTLADEIPLSDRKEYKDLLDFMHSAKTTLERNRQLPKSKYKDFIKNITETYSLGNKKNILEKVKENFKELVREDSYNLQHTITNNNKNNDNLKKEYKKEKREELKTLKTREKVDGLINLMLNVENPQLNNKEQITGLEELVQENLTPQQLQKNKRRKNRQ